jgi:hypothetical protein
MMVPTEADRIARAKWEGGVDRAMLQVESRLTRIEETAERIEAKHDAATERIEVRLSKLENRLTALQTRVLIYGAMVGGVGTLIMLLVLAVATKALS